MSRFFWSLVSSINLGISVFMVHVGAYDLAIYGVLLAIFCEINILQRINDKDSDNDQA
jgi:hypothetical protein